MVEHKRHSMDHDERVVIYELQANGCEAHEEAIVCYLLEFRVIKRIGITPFFEFRMQPLHSLADLFGCFLEALCRIKHGIYSTLQDSQAAELAEKGSTPRVDFRQINVEVVDILSRGASCSNACTDSH